MKNWTLRFRAVDKDNFEELRSGVKSVETRAATVKYEPIQEGDTLTFVCGKDSFTKRIVKKLHFKSVNAMVKKINFKKIMPSVASVMEMKKVYSSYPGYTDKIKKHGLFAFELQ
ncbi:MAG: hypothetical protein Q7S52_00405 [bacterium]|nr:hypothetical protein [bacterium]